MNRLGTASLVTIAFIMVGFVLFVARSFFLPLVIAITIAFLIWAVSDAIRQLPHRFSLTGWAVPRVISIVFAIFMVSIGIHFVMGMIGNNIVRVIEVAPVYQERLVGKLEGVFQGLEKSFGIDIPEQLATLPDRVDFVAVAGYLMGSIGEIASNTGLILIYLLFLLVETGHIEEKVAALFPKRGIRDTAHSLLGKVSSRMKEYVLIKTFLSALTAVCSYGVMAIVGLDLATFWAFLIFLLNFIPNIGSIIATVFPCLVAFIQFDVWSPILVVFIGLTTIQLIVGNILDPKMMGRSFNLSGFVIVVALVAWGAIWGLVGMFLSVPITVMASILFQHFPETRWISVMLSEDGRV